MREGWTYKRISEVSSFVGDGDWIESRHQSEEGIRLIQTGNVGEGVFKAKEDKPHFISEETFKTLGCTEIFAGDCLVSRLPDPVGRACLIPDIGKRMITAVDCTIIRFKSVLKPSLFVYYTRGKQYKKEIDNNTTGTTRKRISRKNLEAVKIPVPPLPEQERIVAELDLLQGVIDKQKEQLKELDTLAQSIFYDMFGDPVENEKGWGRQTLFSVCKDLFAGGDIPKSSFSSVRTTQYYVPIYSNGVGDKALYGYTEIERVSEDSITISGRGTIGYCAVHKAPFYPIVRLIVATPKDSIVIPVFLKNVIDSLHLKGAGVAIPQLTIPMVKNIGIITPPIFLQKSFADKIEVLEGQKAAISKSISETQKLFDYTMDKYFG